MDGSNRPRVRWKNRRVRTITANKSGEALNHVPVDRLSSESSLVSEKRLKRSSLVMDELLRLLEPFRKLIGFPFRRQQDVRVHRTELNGFHIKNPPSSFLGNPGLG